MTPYEKIQYIRELVSDKTIMDSIEQIFSSDQLDELANDLAHEYDIDIDCDDVEDYEYE